VVSLGELREIALALPGVHEGTSFGTPAFRLGTKFLARLWEDGEVLVIRIGIFERDALMHTEPDKYFITPHYADYPAVLVRLAAVEPAELRDLLVDAWHQQAPKRLAAQFPELTPDP
jgi:hypothetical protein